MTNAWTSKRSAPLRAVLLTGATAMSSVGLTRGAHADGLAAATFALPVDIDAVAKGQIDITPVLNSAFPGQGPKVGSGTNSLSVASSRVLWKQTIGWPVATTLPLAAADVGSVWSGPVHDINITFTPNAAASREDDPQPCGSIAVDCSSKTVTPVCTPTPSKDVKPDMDQATLYVSRSSGWSSTTLGTFDSKIVCDAKRKGDFSAWLQMKGGGTAQPVVVHDVAPKDADLSCTPNDKDLQKWLEHDKTVVVSYADFGTNSDPACDLTHASITAPAACLPKTEARPHRGTILGTNERLTVVVVFPDGLASKVSANGTVQTSGPVVQGSALPVFKAQGLVEFGGGPEIESKPCSIQAWQLAPRAAGSEVVSIGLVSASGDDRKNSAFTVELAVEASYVGAIRVGLGLSFASFGKDNWGGTRTYAVHPSPDGGNMVHLDGEAWGNYELLAGYTAFIGNAGGPGSGGWQWGSRPATRLTNFGIGLYAGLGVVSVSTTGSVSGLTSAYVGPEVSFLGFSVQGLIGVRRDTVVADGYAPGAHVPVNFSLPTQNDYFPAVGLGVSVTSDIFKIAGLSVP